MYTQYNHQFNVYKYRFNVILMRRRSLTWPSRVICNQFLRAGSIPTTRVRSFVFSLIISHLALMLRFARLRTRERGSYLDKEESKILRLAVAFNQININGSQLLSHTRRLRVAKSIGLTDQQIDEQWIVQIAEFRDKLDARLIGGYSL